MGFRFFVLRLAQQSGILGEVWNRSDGAVEIIAFSKSKQTLEEFIKELSSGPGEPREVTCLPCEAETDPSEFRIVTNRPSG